MQKKHKIYQKHICINHDKMDNKMILVFTEEKEVVGISIISYPCWFKYMDEQYVYYPLCLN
jgi:hypothetical protein